MKSFLLSVAVLSLICVAVAEAQPTVAETTHWEFQAVDAAGEQVYSASDKVILEGILLHNPADIHYWSRTERKIWTGGVVSCTESEDSWIPQGHILGLSYD